MRFYKTGNWIKRYFSNFEWDFPTQKNTIYLTFDDGPIPIVTEFVLDTLAQFKAKATFFCVGDNIRKHPQIFQKVISQGHQIGNHTFNHLDGWKTDNTTYVDNIQQCQQVIETHAPKTTSLFRPPHGKIKSTQYQQLKNKYRIIMWDVLTYDFDCKLSSEICLQKSIQYTRPGSIIVFHDSIKSEKRLRYALPRYIEHFARQGYTFEALS